MPTGTINFLLRTANNALPINNGSITVTEEGGSTVFYEFINAASGGISKTATLETPPKSLSLDSDDRVRPYSVYTVNVRAEGNYRMQINGVQMFEGSMTQLPIDLIPLPRGVDSPEDANIIFITIPEHALRAEPPLNPNSDPDVPMAAVNIGEGVYIPETVTVHLGAPDDETAPNVTVAFIDYIKNVSSSEVYPSWPREALEANILAQISLTLNRIYTEWYPSRGYDFDITNSTAYDQAFVYGRNIFNEMSVIVDEIFNRYLSRPNSIEPLFASYCNGTTTTCAGLSQWGTVALAENGQDSEAILGFYYGDVNVNETNDIRSPQESYPGEPLSSGDYGENVRIIQEQLNRIAVNFPQLPLIEVNSTFDSSTVNTVREFQRLFVLPVTGVVDRATWYRISQIYGSVKRLAELTSEGQRAVYNQQLYPGSPIDLNSRGSEVQEIQFYLQRIAEFNPVVESPALDGIYGKSTQRAVISFQRAYGLEPDGVIDEKDWNELVRVYNGTIDNVDEPQNGILPLPYPGYDLSPSSSGEYVRYIQQVLNIINNVFLTIPELEEDGIFGSATQQSVNAFALLFGYPQNGTVNQPLWEEINRIFETVNRQCIFATGESEGALPFPEADVAIGSSGPNVTYLQNRINTISSAIPYVGFLAVDGQFGRLTAESVGRLQRIFGLDETQIVNENTWLLINYIYAATINGCLPTDSREAAAFSDVEDRIETVKIYELKELMRSKGIRVGSGPLFGLKSRCSLAKWQIENGITPTGLPDEETRKRLMDKS